jgi:hypothetical protein
MNCFHLSKCICLSNKSFSFTKNSLTITSEQRVTLTLQKSEGIRAPGDGIFTSLRQGVKGEIVVGYLDPLITQDLKSSGFPDVLGRSSKSEAQRVNNMAKDSTPSYEFTFVLGRG